MAAIDVVKKQTIFQNINAQNQGGIIVADYDIALLQFLF